VLQQLIIKKKRQREEMRGRELERESRLIFPVSEVSRMRSLVLLFLLALILIIQYFFYLTKRISSSI